MLVKDDVYLSLASGVYAWIGINFVLGRFNHVHNGKYCNSMPKIIHVHASDVH